jgi:hypothetical protein
MHKHTAWAACVLVVVEIEIANRAESLDNRARSRR